MLRSFNQTFSFPPMPAPSPAVDLRNGNPNPRPMPRPTPPFPPKGASDCRSRPRLCGGFMPACLLPCLLLPACPQFRTCLGHTVQQSAWDHLRPQVTPIAGLTTPAAAARLCAEPGTPAAVARSGAVGGRPGMSSGSSEEPTVCGGAVGEAVPLLAGGEERASQGLRRQQRQNGVQ